jgi:hypothetical protein
MEKEIGNALREAAQEAQVVDPDVVTLSVFADLAEKVTVTGDQVIGAREAVRAMRERKPAFFKETD